VNGAAPGAAAAPATRFAPRCIPLGQAGSLARESLALLARAPLRFFSIAFVLSMMRFLPGAALHAFPGMLAGAALGAILDAGFFRALHTAREGRKPGLPDLGAVFLLPPPKFLLLALSGAVPFLLVLVAWWFDWGPVAMADWGTLPADASVPLLEMPPRERFLRIVIEDLASAPFFFLQPLAILNAWSASRTLSGALLAALANWRWVLALTAGISALVLGIDLFDVKGELASFVAILFLVAVGVAWDAITYVLLQRSLR
jgi:hypothetical protein